MVVKLPSDEINNLIKDLNSKVISVKTYLLISSFQNNMRSNSSIIVSAKDIAKIRVMASPIIIRLKGHNRAYGKAEVIYIDVSSSYDLNIEGINNYQSIIYNLTCPKEIPIIDCRCKTSYISFSAPSLILNGIKFNQYYEFEITASRLGKQSKKKFWIKILEINFVPMVEVLQFSKDLSMANENPALNEITIVSEDYLLLRANISVETPIASLNWYLESSNGMNIQLSSNYNQELRIEKSELIKQNICRIYAKAQFPLVIDKTEIVKNNMTVESFFNYEFKPPFLSGDIEPTIKVTIIERNWLYSVVNIDLKNLRDLDSWIYPIEFTISVYESADNTSNSINMDKSKEFSEMYLIEESISSSIMNAIVSPSVNMIKYKACTTIDKDCLVYFNHFEQPQTIKTGNVDVNKVVRDLLDSTYFKVTIKNTQINSLILILKLYQSNIDIAFKNEVFIDAMSRSIDLLNKNIRASKAQSRLFIEIVKTASLILDSKQVTNLINSKNQFDQVIRTLNDTVLRLIPKMFEKINICKMFMNYEIDKEAVFDSYNKMISSLLNLSNLLNEDISFSITLLNTIMDLIKTFEGCTVQANLFIKAYTQISDKLLGLVKPFYYINHQNDKASHDNHCINCMYITENISTINSRRSYGISFYTEGNNNYSKQYTLITILKGALMSKTINSQIESAPESIDIEVSMMISAKICTGYQESNCRSVNQMSVNIPLAELKFDFNNEMPPTEYYTCFSYNRTPSGLFEYINSLIVRYKSNQTIELSSSLWLMNPCKTLYNSSHLICDCKSSNLIGIKFTNENTNSLKLFLLIIIVAVLSTTYCCSLICFDPVDEKKQSSLVKLQPLLGHHLNTVCGRFCVLATTLHVFSCCRKNPVLKSSKALALFLITVFSLLHCFLALLCMTATKRPKSADEYEEWNPKVNIVVLLLLGNAYLAVGYEVLKRLFLKITYAGMVMFKDEEGKEQVRMGEKIEHRVDEIKVQEMVPEWNMDAQHQPLPKNPVTSASERVLGGEKGENKEGTIGKQVIDVTKEVKDKNKNSKYDIGDEEIILAADEFDEPTRYSKKYILIGTCLIIFLCILPASLTFYFYASINIFAILVSALLTIFCILIYAFIIQTAHIFLMSISDIYSNKLCSYIKRILITEEASMIILRILKVQKAIEREQQLILQNKIIERSKREQNQINFDQYFKNFNDSKEVQFEMSKYDVDMLTGRINRKRHRHPNQTNRVDSSINSEV